MSFSIVAKFGAQDGFSTVFDRMIQAGEKFSSRTNRNFDSVNNHMQALSNKMGTVRNVLAGAFGGYLSFEGLKMLGGGIIKATADFEMFRISFETLLKNKEKGDKFFESIKKFSTVTPYQVQDLSSAAKQLLAFGVTSDTIIGKMNRLTDLSMGDADHFKQLVYAYGKTKTIGIASMRELRMFSTAGVPIFDVLAKFEHVSKMGLLNLVKQRKITFEDIDTALTKLTDKGGQFYQMTYKQAHSLKGLWSTSADILRNWGDTIGNYNGHLAHMKGGLTWFIAHQDELLNDILKVTDALDKTFGYTAKIFKEIKGHWSLISPIVYGVTSAFVAYKLAVMRATVWTGICNTLFAGETIPILTALTGGYYKAAFSQMALNAGLTETGLVALRFAGLVGIVVTTMLALENTTKWAYKSFLPFRRLLDAIIFDIDKLRGGPGVDLNANPLKGSAMQNLEWNSIKGKFTPKYGHEKEFILDKRGFYEPKIIQTGATVMYSADRKTNNHSQKPTVIVVKNEVKVTAEKGLKATTNKPTRTHNLKVAGVVSQ